MTLLVSAEIVKKDRKKGSDITSFFDRILGDRRGTSGPSYPKKLPVKNPLGLRRPSQSHILQGLPHEGVVMTSSNDVIWDHLDISYFPAKKKKVTSQIQTLRPYPRSAQKSSCDSPLI